MIFNYLEESGFGNKLVEIIAEALEPIVEEIRKGEIKMYNDNTVSTVNGCCDAVMSEPSVGDKCHMLRATVKEIIDFASRIDSFMFSGPIVAANETKERDPKCMNEELDAIMEDLQLLRKIVVDISSRL